MSLQIKLNDLFKIRIRLDSKNNTFYVKGFGDGFTSVKQILNKDLTARLTNYKQSLISATDDCRLGLYLLTEVDAFNVLDGSIVAVKTK